MSIELNYNSQSGKLKVRYRFIYILLSLLLLSLPVIGQIINIEGYIELQDSISDPVYNIVALRHDSTIYKGQVYTNSDFSFEVNCDSILCVRFSSLGYEPLFYEKGDIIARKNHQTLHLGKVYLKSDLTLGEITITARKKQVSISPTGYSIDIKNSYLSNYGTFNDIIRRIPGITVSPGGKIEVIGKSNTLFILNGRRLTTTDDLERLEPKDVKTIYIDQNPGPEFDASYDAVVRVETSNYNQEFYTVDLRNRFEYGRRPSNNARAIIQRKDKNFVYGFDIQHNLPQFKQYDVEDKTIWMNTDSVTTHRNTTLNGRDNEVLLVPSVQWTIDKNNKLEVIYRFNHNKYYLDSKQEYISTILREKTFVNTYLRLQEKKNGHNPSLFYIYDKNNHRFQISTDYYVMNTNQNQQVEENYKYENIINNQDFKDKYEIFGSAFDYVTTISSWQINSGAKLSGIRDNGKYKTNDEPLSSSSLKDNTYALYAGASSRISALSFSAALRAEWNNINYCNSNYKDPVSSDYFNIFPSATVKYAHSYFTTALSYNKRIRRPTYRELNPNKSYIDPLSYMVGNPLLKPRITHDLSLSFQHSDLLFIIAYGIQYNSQAGILELTSDNKIAYTNTNIPKIKNIDLVGIYSFNNKWLHSNLSLQAKFQDIRFQNRIYSKLEYAPRIISKLNLDFNLWKNGDFNIIGYYYTNYRMDVSKMKNSGYISLELNQNISKDKWRLTAGLTDILKTYRPNTWKSNLSNAYINMDSDADSRYFYIMVQYRIGKMKPPRNSNSIISDEKNRL